MAPSKPAGKVAIEFDAIIDAERQRRKNQELASEIFGNKNRRSSAPGAGNRRPGTGPSLASRIGTAGVTKRAVLTAAKSHLKPSRLTGHPAPNLDAEWTHDLHSDNAQRGSRPLRGNRGNRGDHLYNALHASASSPNMNTQFNIVSNLKPMSIRGLAGPYTVVAKNFAPGTTAADIESAMTPIGGVAMRCDIISERPTVIAELIYETKEGADNVVQTFNGQNADGNLLLVYHKLGGSIPRLPAAPAAQTVIPVGPRADAGGYGGRSLDRYQARERSRERSKRDYELRTEIMDGSYGFDDRMDTDDRDDKGRGIGGLYSDSLATSRGRGRGNSRDRGRGNDRGSRYYN